MANTKMEISPVTYPDPGHYWHWELFCVLEREELFLSAIRLGFQKKIRKDENVASLVVEDRGTSSRLQCSVL
jgi:hypothetical protein